MSVCKCADFSTGLNNNLEDNTYSLQVHADSFTKLNGGKYFVELTDMKKSQKQQWS